MYVSERPARISLVTYYGLEGLGSLDFQAPEGSSEVRLSVVLTTTSAKRPDLQGINEDIELSGSVQSLGDFKFRQVELSSSGPPTRLRHADDFGELIDRIAYIGQVVPMGQSWRAKEVIMGESVQGAQEKMKKYGQENAPDPAVLFALSNEVREGSNFYAFQKTYQGSFAIDVFYESSSNSPGAKLDCKTDSVILSITF